MNAADIIADRALERIEQTKLAIMPRPSLEDQTHLVLVRKRMREAISICREDEEFKDRIWGQYPEWCIWMGEQEKKGRGV